MRRNSRASQFEKSLPIRSRWLCSSSWNSFSGVRCSLCSAQMNSSMSSSETTYVGDADSHSGRDVRLMGFLQQVSVRTRVYAGAHKFVDELHRRWTMRRGPGEVIALGTAPRRFLPPEREMPDHAVFVSYARDDLPAVQRLKAGLDAAGIPAWFDLERLEGGDDYDRKIQRNIARCSYFLPVVSASTERRLEGFFRREWSYAIDRTRNMADDAVFVLPVCIDDTDAARASVPDKFKSVHFTRLPGGEVTPEFAKRLDDLVARKA